jgi:WD40 repeat protein
VGAEAQDNIILSLFCAREELKGKAVLQGYVVPDGWFIACGGYNEHVRIWDTRSGKLWKVLRGHRDGVEAVKFSPDGRLLAGQSLDGSVKIQRLY